MLGIEALDTRAHDVAAHVAAGAERGARPVAPVQVAHERSEPGAAHVVELDALARGDADRAVGEALRGLVEGSPAPSVVAPAGGALDPHHEDVVVRLAAALPPDLLLVDAEALGDLLGLVREGLALALRGLLDLVAEGVPLAARGDPVEPLALDLEALVLRHAGELARREAHGHGELRVLGHAGGSPRGWRAIPRGIAG